MATEESTNGGGGVKQIKVDVLELTLTREPWHLRIAGVCDSDDVALSMLLQAVRYYESRLKLAQVAEIQKQLRDQAANEAVARALRTSAGR